MPLDQTAIVKQIDDILAKTGAVSGPAQVSTAFNVILSAIQRLAPSGTTYANSVKSYERFQTASLPELARALQPLRGTLQALKHDYELGYLQSVVELVHADIFADFLEMAQYLLEQSYKDPSAVVCGSVLEAHLWKLCDKHGISVIKPDGSPKKADTLNSELTGTDIYSKLDQKSVTAWLDLRNKAAHGKYSEYTKDQVALMLQGVRDFASRYPA